jgi:hypothetical protein
LFAGTNTWLDDTRIFGNRIYGSGRRAGLANTDHGPWTMVCLIRNGAGIGVFAPQFGLRRGYFVGFSQS